MKRLWKCRNPNPPTSLWLYSIKTRIETFSPFVNALISASVYDFIPLKQGLKHSICVVLHIAPTVYDFIPLKQGLKRKLGMQFLHWWQVYDFIPLKQGLKRMFHAHHFAHNSVYDFIPLKQGLKPRKNTFECVRNFCLWLYSIKTRIET